MILTTIQSRTIVLTAARLRLPSIKFRYGAARDNKTSAAATGGSTQTKPQQSGDAIYDFQLPQRFKKRPIDQEEIEYINRGGPA